MSRTRKTKRSGRIDRPEAIPILNPNAAGLDIGANEIYAAVPSDRDEQPVRCFGTFTQELNGLCAWLHQCRIKTVAMEATGVYWIPTYQILETSGLEVPPRATHKFFASTVAGFLTGALVVASVLYPWRHSTSPSRVTRFTIPFEPGEVLNPSSSPNLAISPDGSRVAHASTRNGRQQVSIRAIDWQDAKLIPDAIGGAPFFSGDGKWLVFYHSASETLKKVALSGGAPVTITLIAGIAGATWGDDGNVVWSFFDLFTAPAAGGKAKTLLKADPKSAERFYKQPCYLPGEAILFTIGNEDNDSYNDAHIGVLSLETGKKKILLDGGMCPRYSPSGTWSTRAAELS